MANNLTGEFDLVAEFALHAANRMLASMHRSERFQHSIATRVDDTLVDPNHASVFGGIDAFGAALANHLQIGDAPTGPRRPPSLTSLLILDGVVNTNVGVLEIPPIVPSLLKGKAQLQLFPPTVDVPDASGNRLTVHIPMMSRYFPDKNTAPLAEFIRGDIQITASITQVVSQTARVIEVDLRSANVQINFTTSFTSRPLTAEDVAAVRLLLGNALKTSFLPSNATLPAKIAHIQFKTMLATQRALAVLLNMSGGAGNPASATNIFLGAGDDFAFAAGVDFIKAQFQPTLDRILSNPIDPVRFNINLLFTTVHVTYTIRLNSATITLQTGKIVLEIRGHAHTSTAVLPDFDFTVKQDLSLAPDGATANLVIGDLSFDTSSFIVDRFKGGALDSLARARDRALAQSNAQQTVRKMLSADENLGGFLTSLLNPPVKGPTQPPLESPTLTYTAVDIQPSGIVLHGALAVPAFPPPHIEFEQIPGTDLGPIGNTVFSGPDYTALNSWIPGGIVDRYEWSRLFEQGKTVETNRFIFRDVPVIVADAVAPAGGGGAAGGATGGGGIVAPPPLTVAIPAYHPLCLTVIGRRPSASGPFAIETVSGASCGFDSFPVTTSIDTAKLGALPVIALPHANADGRLEVTGQTPPRVDPTNTQIPNRLVHFADDKSVSQLNVLADAVLESKRTDAPTAVIAALTPSQLSAARFVPGVTYADDENGAWSKLFGGGSTRPLTLLLGPKGNELWRYEGPLDKGTLVDTLRRYLVARKPLLPSRVSPSARIGLPPPNILFSYAPGRDLTLRKLNGSQATLVFWRSTSRPSIEAVRDAGYSPDPTAAAPIVIAINDGEAPEVAARVFAEQKLTANLVVDPDRSIAQAYRVQVWPTTIVVDGRGLVTRVATGRDRGADAAGNRG